MIWLVVLLMWVLGMVQQLMLLQAIEEGSPSVDLEQKVPTALLLVIWPIFVVVSVIGLAAHIVRQRRKR